jgi:hypothetical protein
MSTTWTKITDFLSAGRLPKAEFYPYWSAPATLASTFIWVPGSFGNDISSSVVASSRCLMPWQSLLQESPLKRGDEFLQIRCESPVERREVLHLVRSVDDSPSGSMQIASIQGRRKFRFHLINIVRGILSIYLGLLTRCKRADVNDERSTSAANLDASSLEALATHDLPQIWLYHWRINKTKFQN